VSSGLAALSLLVWDSAWLAAPPRHVFIATIPVTPRRRWVDARQRAKRTATLAFHQAGPPHPAGMIRFHWPKARIAVCIQGGWLYKLPKRSDRQGC
jgi:hypothetical protein